MFYAVQLVCLNVVIQSDNTMLVQKIESDVPAAVQNEPGIKDESHMGNLSFRILEKGQISETGFLQGNFFAESDLLRGIAGQGDTLGLEYGLGKSGAIRSPRGAFATTVVGLFSSAVGFAVQQIKRRWYVEEMNQLVFVAELLKEKHSGQ